MNKLKKLLTAIISLSLLITTIPANAFSASYAILPQYEFDNFAKITSANFCQNSPAVVINIQDLHSSKEVQDSIFKLLEKLNNKYENMEVYLEGASTSVDYNKFFSKMESEAVSALMKALYEDDKISGAEFFGYKTNKILQPTEQKNVYDRNIQNYAFLIKNKKEIEYLLSEKYSKIKTLDKYLTKGQRKLLKTYNAYLRKKISTEKFYNKVFYELNKRKISSFKYINTKLYYDILKANKKINQTAAKKQLQSVLADLKSNISYQDYVNLLQDSKNLSDINVIFAYLSANINPADKITKYPDLFKLINLREISSLIDPLDLIEEEREIVEDILLSYAMTVENRDVVFMNLFFQAYKSFLLAAISSKEYDYYKRNNSGFVNLYSKYIQDDNLFNLNKYVSVAESFNELNFERNKAFVDNLVSISDTDNKKNNYRGKLYSINKILSGLDTTKNIKVIISGGFHTEGINELLREKNVSYITLTPNVKKADLIYEQNYLDSIVKQAEADINAISKKPFTEEDVNSKADTIISELNKILEYITNKGVKETNEIIQAVIEQCGVGDIIKFNIDSEGVATIKTDGKIYVLNYENGIVSVKTDFTTTLAKNIKLLIKKALGIETIKMKLSVSNQEFKAKGGSVGVANQIAANLLLNQNILLPQFANRVMRAIIGLEPAYETASSREYRLLEEVLKQQYNDLGEEYPKLSSDSEDNPIKIGSSPLLIGAQQDGYGNAEEYGSLFYVVWTKHKETGADMVKEVFVSDILFSKLADLSDAEVKQFFQNLITHERLEMIALSGKSQRYNSHSENFPMTSEGFHKYIMEGSDFKDFLKDQAHSEKQVEAQRSLLKQLDDIISSVNEQNSEYSGITSLVSFDEKSTYLPEDIERFLSVRTGEEQVVLSANNALADKICKKLKQEYDLTHHNGFDVKEFVKFVNDNYAFIYKNTNKYMHFENLPVLVKQLLRQKYIEQWSNDSQNKAFVSSIFLPIYEIDEDTLSIAQKKQILGKNIFFVEDIISRNSRTYNKIYHKLLDLKVAKVQPFVFFDLSKEPEGDNVITNMTYRRITKDPQLLFKVISNTIISNTKNEEKIKKYIFYWLVRLLKDPEGIGTLKDLSENNSEIVKTLIIEMFKVLEKGETILNVKNTEIVELILFMGLGEKKSAKELTKQDLDGILQKYNITLDIDTTKPLEVKYDDWKDNIPYLIIYSYMCKYRYIDAGGINNILEVFPEKEYPNNGLIERFCRKFDISMVDRKTKLKYFFSSKDNADSLESLLTESFNMEVDKLIEKYKKGEILLPVIESFVDEKIQNLINKYSSQEERYNKLVKEKDILKNKYVERAKLEYGKYFFDLKIKTINEKYNNSEITYFDYLKEVEKAEEEYRSKVKAAMVVAKNMVLEKLKIDGIHMKDSMFAIIIGGSLTKGNITKDSDVYYDVIVKNDIISKSIEEYFAPLYSSMLRDLGLVNYHVSKYSTTSLDKRNINTFVDEQEVVPFLNYEVLEGDKAESVNLYNEYMSTLLREILDSDSFSTEFGDKQLYSISQLYYIISKEGSGWLGNSFYSMYDGNKDKIFTTKWTLKTLETILNNLMLKQIGIMFASNKGFAFQDVVHVSVKEQIEFLKNSMFVDNKEQQKLLDEVFESWEFLSACRYDNNEVWSDFSEQKKKAVQVINDFARPYVMGKTVRSFKTKIKNSKDFLNTIEKFVYDNSTNPQVYRIGYDKYSHLAKWKEFADGKNEEYFIMAQAIVLLLELGDIETIKSKLEELKITGIKKYLPALFDSLDAIKKIDEQFKDFRHMEGERSLQNYWDLVAKTAGNEETLLALIAHKLTQAKYPNPEKYLTEEQIKEAKTNATLLVHSVYLPLSRRFGIADMYEYVRNDLFEISNPKEYLNLLNIIETLYGQPYTQFNDFPKQLKEKAEKILKEQGLPDGSFTIKFRPKFLYSIHEKLNSERRKDEIVHTIGKIEKGMIKVMLSNEDNPLFNNILKKAYINNVILTDKDKQFIIDNIDDIENIEQNYENISDQQKKYINQIKEYITQIVSVTRQTIFENYDFVDYIKKSFEQLPEKLFDKDNNLRKIKDLMTYLEENGMWVELYFVNIFKTELKDLIGLHIIINDKTYDNDFSDEMLQKFYETFSLEFDELKRDSSKQAKIKFSGLKSSLPSEICIYRGTDYNEETYGFYNLENIFSPHYQYKTGREIEVYPEVKNLIDQLKILEEKLVETGEKDSIEQRNIEEQITKIRSQIKLLMSLVLFEGTFIHEIALKFVIKTDDIRKQFVFTPDEYNPSTDLEENRTQIFESKDLENKTIFFVEYNGEYFVMDFTKDATIYELINSKYFADEEQISVYDEKGNPLRLDDKLENAKVYKIIAMPSEASGKDILPKITDEDLKDKSVRTQLQYLSKTSVNKSNIKMLFEKIKNYSDINEFLAFLIFNENNSVMLDERSKSVDFLAEELYDENSKNEILGDKEVLEKTLENIFNLMDRFGLKGISPSVFIKRSTMIANHYNLLNMFELFEAVNLGIIDFGDIVNYYRTCIFIKTKSKNITEKQILDLLATKLGVDNISPVNTRTDPNAKYNIVLNNKKYHIEYNGYEFAMLKDLLESQDIHFEYVADRTSREIGKEENKEKVFITMDFVRPQEFLPLKALGNNVEQLVLNTMMYHDRIVMSTILSMIPELANKLFNRSPQEIAQQYEATPKTEESISALLNENPILMTQILLGIFSKDSYSAYDEQVKLSKETPYLTQEDLNIIMEFKTEDFSEFSSLFEEYGIDIEQELKKFSEKKLEVSKSLDLIEDKDVFAFATTEVASDGVTTFYISEAFLRELSNASEEERQEILKQLIMHEIIEHILINKLGMTYEQVHKEFENFEGQRKLMDKAKESAPNISRTREQMLNEIYGLMEKDDFVQTDADKTIAFMFGNLNVDSFIKTYKLYTDKQVGRIFISGNIRGSLGILKILRDMKNHPEYKPFLDGIVQDGDRASVRTVRDLLSLSEAEFNKLTSKELENIEAELKKIRTEVDPLQEFEKRPLNERPSKNEIFELVSRDGLNEAAIIKWIMLESARQENKTRKEIIDLIRSMSLETVASNTLQNIENICATEEFKDFIKGKNDIDVIIIQNPFSQTRAKATFNKYLHENKNGEVLQGKNFAIHTMNFDGYDLDYYPTTEKLMKSLGEWTRLIAYTLKEDIIPIRDKKEGLDAIPSDIFTDNVLPLITILNDKEKEELKNIFGFLYDKNAEEIKNEFLQELDDKEKKGIEKILKEIKDIVEELKNISDDEDKKEKEKEKNKKKDEAIKLVLKGLLINYSNKEENKMEQKKCDLIEKFIEELFSDTTEQRQVEQDQQDKQQAAKTAIAAEDEIPDISVEMDGMSFEKEGLRKTHELLAAA
ncbi:MAG: hypothetical protein IKO48_04140 [Elusimicrobia bacterium]|nr:hypothetical protein [Elusimicrobiota bacterium]